MPARLVALDGTGDIRLTGLLTIVGRHRDCHVHLDSSRVSRRHCCLALGADGVLVRDLGSTNGVKINDTRLHEGLLRPGDVLSIAHLRFRLDMPASAETGAAEGQPTASGQPSTPPDDDSGSHASATHELCSMHPRSIRSEDASDDRSGREP